jgi:hypothetical protein
MPATASLVYAAACALIVLGAGALTFHRAEYRFAESV